MMGKNIKNPNAIGFKEKTAFAMANIGNIPIMTLMSGYLLIFYTDVVGLNAADIATLFLITRILDGINDPVMGFVIDHLPRTKLGRFRGYLLFGSIICALNFLLVWMGPLWASSGKLVIAYISYVLIGLTFDLTDIPLNSLIPVMTDDMKERNSLSVIKGLFVMIGGAIIAISVPLILDNTTILTSAYTGIIVFFTIFIVVLTVPGALGVRERIEPIKQEKYRLRDMLHILTLRPYWQPLPQDFWLPFPPDWVQVVASFSTPMSCPADWI